MKRIISVLLLTMYIVTNFTFSVSADVDASLYTTNLFGDAYYNCSEVGIIGRGNLAQKFDQAVETGPDAYDQNGSIKLSGKRHFLFEKTVDADLRNTTVQVSFWLKATQETIDGQASNTKTIQVFAAPKYNEDDNPETTDVDESETYNWVVPNKATRAITTNEISTDWQNFTVTIEIPQDVGLEDGQNYQGMSFFARIATGNVGVRNGTTAWIDCISAYAIPGEGVLETSVESINHSENAEGKTETVTLTVDTEYVNASGAAAMIVNCDGESLTSGVDYTVSVSGKEITITLLNPKYVKNFAVSGIKDQWGREINCEENSVFSIQREETRVTSIKENKNEYQMAESIEIALNTIYVDDACLDGITVNCDGEVVEEGLDFDVQITTAAGGNKTIVISFVEPRMFETFSFSGLKDVWGETVDTSLAAIKNYNVNTYTKNLLGDAFTKCDTASDLAATIGTTGYTRSIDATTSYNGTGAIKIEGASGAAYPNVVCGSFSTTREDAPGKFIISAFVKASEDLIITSNGKHPISQQDITAEGVDKTGTFARVRFYADVKYIMPGSSDVLSKSLGNPVISINAKSTDWQYVSATITPDYSALPENAIITKIECFMRLDNGGAYTKVEQGCVWIDEVKVLRVPTPGEYPVSYIGSEPQDGGTDAPTGSVTFKFSGPVEAGSLSKGVLLVNGEATEATFKGIYDRTQNVTKILVTPKNGFENSTAYTVSITGLRDVWGTDLTGTFSTSFTTTRKYDVQSSFVKVTDGVEGEALTRAESGDIKAKFSVTNNTQDNAEAILVLAECSGDTITRFVLSAQETIAPGETQSLAAMISGFTVGEGKYLRAFVWNNVDEHLIMSQLEKLE